MLTNGIVYQFFGDLDEPNKLDARPFLIVDMLHLREDVVAEAGKMTKEAFSLDEMLSTANALKYQREIRSVLEAQLEGPDEDFVKLMYLRVASGRFSQTAREQFTPLVRKAFAQLVSERVSDRLRSALASEGISPAVLTAPPDTPAAPTAVSAPAPGSAVADPEVVTTDEEIEGFRVVRAIVCSVLPVERVVYRDAKTYFAILVDDNNRKPICRLWFNASQRYLGLLDEEKKETRHPIGSATEIYRFAAELRAAASKYADLLQ